MLAVSLDVIALEISTAYRTCQDRRHAQRTRFVNEQTQVVAIGGLRVRAACIGRSRKTFLLAISCILLIVHAIGYRSFVIMRELDDEVVALAHLALDGSPISSAVVETTGVGTGLTAVIHCDIRRIEERTEIHTPPSFVRGGFIILSHGAVTNRVHLNG